MGPAAHAAGEASVGGQTDWSRAVIDSSHVRAARRGPTADPARSTARVRAANTTSSPRPRGAHMLSGGNRNDVTQLLPLLDKAPAVPGRVGRPRRRPEALLADRGYAHDRHRRLPWKRGIRPVIAQRCQRHGSGLGILGWVVGRTIAWLHGFRRLCILWERRDDIPEAFLGLATCLITHRHVQRLG
ncbi:transposase [Streptomyces massasporeus]|uniref:transposase n=1 Tax=Streptomyces massasporeus TaxID=67324 RepID=UPI00367D0529